MLRIDGKIPQQSFFDVGVCGLCGGLNGEAGQHHGCHDQQKRQKRDCLALFPYGIQAGPFPQIHFIDLLVWNNPIIRREDGVAVELKGRFDRVFDS